MDIFSDGVRQFSYPVFIMFGGFKVWPEANLAHLMDDSIPNDVCDANGGVNDREADERI